MKTNCTTTVRYLWAILVLASSHHASAAMVTLAFETNSPPPEVEVKTGFTAKLVSWPWQASYYTSLEIVVAGRTNTISRNSTPDGFIIDPLIVAGPATVRLTGSRPGFCTIEVVPESFPPDRTLIIPEGTGARLALECSTNLLTWAEVWTQTYTNVPSSKFFRIKAERIP